MNFIHRNNNQFSLSIIIIQLIVIGIFYISNVNTKCVMYDACTNTEGMTQLTGIDPRTMKWYNCLSNREPSPMNHSMDYLMLFKKICPVLYTSDDQAVCCSHNQLRILSFDLDKARSIIGSCPSCYLNFRTMWCTLACSANQSEIVFAEKVESMVKANFTHAFIDAENWWNKDRSQNLDENSEQTNVESGDASNGGNDNEEKRKSEDLEHETNDEVDNDSVSGSDDDNVSNGNEQKRKRRASSPEKVNVVTRLRYFVSEEFVGGLLKSCADIKLYMTDAIEPFCGYPSKQCTPQLYGKSLGETVVDRPFDIVFDFSAPEQRPEPFRHMGQANPRFYQCNESYDIPNIEIGAQCGCKACSASCTFGFEYKMSEKPVFLIGSYDGAMVLMTLIFFMFTIAFLVVLMVLRYRQQKRRLPSPGDNSLKRMKSSDGEDKNKLGGRLSDIYFLDKLQNVGEKFESNIEYRFSLLGRFCSTYPKLVLFIGFGFCSIMCLGFINFKVEQDPVELWSARSSVARQNKQYFDENFGPFYRITQLIIVPKPVVGNDGQQLNINQEMLKFFDSATLRTEEYSYALSAPILREIYTLYDRLNNLTAFCPTCNNKKGKRITLNDICYKPLAPQNNHCAIQSVFQYWQNNRVEIEEALNTSSHIKRIKSCMENTMNCLGQFGGPVQPYLIVGGFKTNDTTNVLSDEYLTANAIVITYVIKNYNKDLPNSAENLEKALRWESEALRLLKSYNSNLIDVFFYYRTLN